MSNEKKYVEKIRDKYLDKEESKIDKLRNLDKKTRHGAKIFSYIFGSIGTLILGFGMSVAMGVILAEYIWIGILVGIIGILMVSINYFIYRKLVNNAKELENDNLSKEERLKYLKHIENATLKLNDLVMNILKLNKLENQTLNIENKRFNLSESIINQIIAFETLIDKKNISLSCDIDEDIYISSSEETLEIIWNNLISNAIKFTNEFGSIEIKLFKKDSRIIFEIADSGCGIDKDEGKYIFEKFFQCETSHSNEGNGLGLPLVKRVIDLIGGEIEVTSQINIGTTFIVKLKEN